MASPPPTSRRDRSEGSQDSRRSVRRRLLLAEATLIGLVTLAGVGIVVTDVSPRYGLWFWVTTIPVFAAVALYGERRQAAPRGGLRFVLPHLLHWLGVLVAVLLVFFLERNRSLGGASSGLVALLVLAVGTFLAGVHTDSRFYAVGVVLGTAVASAAYFQQYVWILLLPGFVAVVVVGLWIALRARSRRVRAPQARAGS